MVALPVLRPPNVHALTLCGRCAAAVDRDLPSANFVWLGNQFPTDRTPEDS